MEIHKIENERFSYNFNIFYKIENNKKNELMEKNPNF